MKAKLMTIVLSFFGLWLIGGVALAAVSPISLLQKASNQMISSLEKNKNRLNQSGVIYRIVNANLIPHIAVYRMAASVVGRQHWQGASAAERQQFIKLFIQKVVSYYSSAIASYDGDRVRFYPLRGGYVGRRTVSVRSVIIRRTGQRVPISYKLVRSGDTWKVYDFSIENVSIVRNYRAQFASVLASAGLQGLINQLRYGRRGRRR